MSQMPDHSPHRDVLVELTAKQQQRLCTLAAARVERRKEEFKPEKPVLRESTDGQIVEQIWCGSSGDMTVCALAIKWWYSSALGVQNVAALVHVKQQVYRDQAGHFRVRLIDLHQPVQFACPSGRGCATCGPDFQEHQVIMADTLHEF